MTPILSCQNISKSFSIKKGVFSLQSMPFFAVKNVSLNLYKGQTFGLVGESGCGKSTLARMMLGLIPPNTGNILMEGQPLNYKKSHPEQVQMVFQDPFSSLNPRLSIGFSIAEPLYLLQKKNKNKTSKQELKKEVLQMLERVGLPTDCYDRFPHEFSGGQRQRIALARALITHPRLLICDEPVSALDTSVQAQVLNLLRDIQEELQLCYFFISHDLQVVSYMSNTIAVMYLGQIVEEGTRDKILQNPLHPYTKALLHASQKEYNPISGELQNPLSQDDSSCAFYPRCPIRQECCKQEEPTLQNIDGDHTVRCFLYKTSA